MVYSRCDKCVPKCYEGDNAQFSDSQLASYGAPVSGDTRATLNEMEHGQDHLDNAQISMSNYSSSDKENTLDNSYFSNNSQKSEDSNYDRHRENDQKSNKTVELNTIESELESKSKNQDIRLDTSNYNLKIDNVDPTPPPFDRTVPLEPRPELNESASVNYPSSKSEEVSEKEKNLEEAIQTIENVRKELSK